MPIVDIFDRKGNVIKAEYLDKFFFLQPPFADDLQSHLNLIHELDLRDDDVMICAYPKCGTHWVWEMVQMIRSGEVRYDSRSKEVLMIDFMLKETLDSMPSPRTLNSHFLFRHLPKQIAPMATKIIYINRDPRDVAVSLFNHMKGLKTAISSYTGEFADYLPLFLEGTVPFDSWFDYTKDWQRTIEQHPDIPVLYLYYEDMKQDPVGAVKELSAFLGVQTSDNFCAAVAQACDFSKLRDAHVREKTDPLQFMWKEDHPGIYRKGQTGDWKNWFTVAQEEEFEAFFIRKMAGTNVFQRYLKGASDQQQSPVESVGS